MNELNTQKETLKTNESNKTEIMKKIDNINKEINQGKKIPRKILIYNEYVNDFFNNDIKILNNKECIKKLENKLSERFTDLKKQENENNNIYDILQIIDKNKKILENKLVSLKVELNSLKVELDSLKNNKNKGTQYVNIDQSQISESDKLKNEIKALEDEKQEYLDKSQEYLNNNNKLDEYFKNKNDPDIKNINLTNDLQDIIKYIPALQDNKFKNLIKEDIIKEAFEYTNTKINEINTKIKEIEIKIKKKNNINILINPPPLNKKSKLSPLGNNTIRGGSDINIDDDNDNANAKIIINQINKLIISIYNKILDINNKDGDKDGDKDVNIVVNIDGDKDGDKDVIIDGDTFFNKKINNSVVSLKKTIIEFNYLLFYTHVLFIIFYVYNNKNKIIKPIISFKELVIYYCIIDVLLLNKKKPERIYIYFYKYHYLNLKIVYNFFKKIIDKIINHNNEEIKQLIVINNYEKIIINLFNINYTDSMKKAIIIFIALRPILLECYNLIINEQKDRQKYIFDKINSKILDKINSN